MSTRPRQPKVQQNSPQFDAPTGAPVITNPRLKEVMTQGAELKKRIAADKTGGAFTTSSLGASLLPSAAVSKTRVAHSSKPTTMSMVDSVMGPATVSHKKEKQVSAPVSQDKTPEKKYHGTLLADGRLSDNGDLFAFSAVLHPVPTKAGELAVGLRQSVEGKTETEIAALPTEWLPKDLSVNGFTVKKVGSEMQWVLANE